LRGEKDAASISAINGKGGPGGTFLRCTSRKKGEKRGRERAVISTSHLRERQVSRESVKKGSKTLGGKNRSYFPKGKGWWGGNSSPGISEYRVNRAPRLKN